MQGRGLRTRIGIGGALRALLCFAVLSGVAACKKASAVSAEQARVHVALLAKTAASDVAEIRTGLPQGVTYLVPLFKTGKPASDDPRGALSALETARNKVYELRVAKSTFFAVTDASGVVIRSNQELDALATRPIFPAFPELRGALAGHYVETRGALPEAAGVKGRPDGQWVAAAPIADDGEVKGLFVSGWSWSAYAYRLENALGSQLRAERGEGDKLPLVYVYIIVDKNVFGTPISPDVNAREIRRLAPLASLKPGQPSSFELEITGREFGLGVMLSDVLGPHVAIAVLRSET